MIKTNMRMHTLFTDIYVFCAYGVSSRYSFSIACNPTCGFNNAVECNGSWHIKQYKNNMVTGEN